MVVGTIANVPELREKKGDAWAEFFASRQTLKLEYAADDSDQSLTGAPVQP